MAHFSEFKEKPDGSKVKVPQAFRNDGFVVKNDLYVELGSNNNRLRSLFDQVLACFLKGVSINREEEAAISSLRTLFGSKINDYMIVVFTSGDELEENEQTLEEFLEDCPESLKETLSLCGDRCVL